MAVAVDVAPQAADAIEILVGPRIDERAAVGRSMRNGSYSAIWVKACQTAPIPAAKFVVRRHVGHHSTATGALAQAFSNLTALPLTTAISKKPLDHDCR